MAYCFNRISDVNLFLYSNINPLGHHVSFFNTGGLDMVTFYLRFSYQCSDYMVFPLFPYLSSSVFATHLPLIQVSKTEKQSL